jgi:AraC family transcriptional regulator of arabinose operon
MLIEPRARHDYGPADKAPWQCIWVVFDAPAHWRVWLNWPAVGGGHFQLPAGRTSAHRQAVANLRRAHGLAVGGERMRAALAMNALEAALLWCETCNAHSVHDRLDERVRRAVEFIRMKMGSKIGLDDIAAAAGLSVPHLSRMMHQHLGVSPRTLLERERLARARQLLDLTSMTVQAIAWEVGFENGFYFATRFKRDTGQTPTEYRRGQRNQRGSST